MRAYAGDVNWIKIAQAPRALVPDSVGECRDAFTRDMATADGPSARGGKLCGGTRPAQDALL